MKQGQSCIFFFLNALLKRYTSNVIVHWEFGLFLSEKSIEWGLSFVNSESGQLFLIPASL